MSSVMLNREDLVNRLSGVEPGLARKKVIIEQSNCFAFRGGKVVTFNDEVFCRADSPFGGVFEGAVQAKPLLEVLRKMTDEKVEVSRDNGCLVVKGKKKRASVKAADEILLPIDKVESPGTWKKLDKEFVAAVRLVAECAGRDERKMIYTCVHFHPDYVEASDNRQFARYRLPTGVKESTIIRADTVKHACALDVTKFYETDSWTFFKNKVGFEIACRRWAEPYKDFTPVLEVKGGKLNLPPGLADAAEKAQIFSKEESDDNQVLVELAPNRIRVKGEGQSGQYVEWRGLEYKGPPVAFYVSPVLLIEMIRGKKYAECVVNKDRLKVDGGNFAYVAVLAAVEAKE